MALDTETEETLLAIYNDAWDKGTTPPECGEAIVVTIFNGKGLDADPGNHRPISLLSELNVMHKVYASMLQHRSAALIEPRLRNTTRV